MDWGDPKVTFPVIATALAGANAVLSWLYRDHDTKNAVKRHEDLLDDFNKKRSQDMSLMTGKIGSLEIDMRVAETRLDGHDKEISELQRKQH